MVKNIDRDKVLLILIWCENTFGKSKYRKTYPKIRVYKSKGNSDYVDHKYGLRGYYYKGTISIFLNSLCSIRELCYTVIHEYKHYLLPDYEYNTHIKKMKKLGHNSDYIYFNHPHEKRANRTENNWGEVCYKKLKNKLYSKI
jgi:Zn-dependent peptidase ImmA (M78 family)